MAYTNSTLVTYTKLSPNNSGTRTHSIDRISPHCVVGQCSIESLGNWFAQTAAQASSNYGIDKDGRVGLYVEEKNRSWCTSSNANDQRAVTVECASDTYDPYRMNDCVYARLIELCTDICVRNGKNKVIWISDKDKALAYEPKSNEMLITVHRWFAWKSCPGDWLFNRLGDLADAVNARLTATIAYRAHVQTYGWLPSVRDGEIAGTVGKGKRMEALKITPPDGVELEVDLHMQSIGWKTYKGIKKGASSGTGSSDNDPLMGSVNEKRRIEAIRIRCAKNPTGKKLKYQVHCQTYGWMDVASEGELTGTVGKSKRMEAIKIWFE